MLTYPETFDCTPFIEGKTVVYDQLEDDHRETGNIFVAKALASPNRLP